MVVQRAREYGLGPSISLLKEKRTGESSTLKMSGTIKII